MSGLRKHNFWLQQFILLPYFFSHLIDSASSAVPRIEDEPVPNRGTHVVIYPTTTVHPATSEETSEFIRSVSLNDPQIGTAGPLFEQLSADQTGIDFSNSYPIEFQAQYNMLGGAFGVGGVCIGDYDGDGLADIYLTSAQQSNRLYRNLGNMRFEDVTAIAGVGADHVWSSGATFVDIDNDNNLDLYVCVYNDSNRLFLNQGDGTFQDATHKSKLDARQANVMMSFEDYDSDGDLDAYLVTHRFAHLQPQGIRYQKHADGRVAVEPKLRQLYMILQHPDGTLSTSQDGQNDRMFQNLGDGTFRDVSSQVGLIGDAPGLAASWWDYNDDGHPDLYVSNDFKEPDHLYHNNGNGTFKDVIRDTLPHLSWFSMGTDTADINNDGRFDLMTSDMSGTSHFRQKVAMGAMGRSASFLKYANPQQYMRNALFVNTGTERFLETAYMAGLANSNWTWSVKLGDLDNDGWVDVLITNGTTRDWLNSDFAAQREALQDKQAKALFWQNSPTHAEQNMSFRNRGDLRFEDTSKLWGLDHEGVSYSAALGDLDRDGDLDLVINNFDSAPFVYRNRSKGHRLLLRLVGTESNRYGIGAKVTLDTASGRMTRRLHLASGFMSANEPLVQFGMGEQKQVQQLLIRWPSGYQQTFEHLEADRFYTITEPTRDYRTAVSLQGADEALQSRNSAATDQFPKPLYQELKLGLELAIHQERPYDDFASQPLLPNKLSQLGPGMALGDVDGDGDEDLYLSGAAGQSGQLFLRNQEGNFIASSIANDGSRPKLPFAEDAEAEDMAPLLFDADGDGDLDLLVVSGGVECEPDSPILRDRLYLGDGQGNFSRTLEALPDLRDSGAAACAADFDRDGDLDLFVGGRVIPGQYPRTPKSRLLINDGEGHFSDMTRSLAPELLETGLVTSALWSDVDDDGWLDLLVTHEWGPVKLFHNEQGRFVDRTNNSGLSQRLGWWNGIASGDIDQDGDIDYVVTNVGLNTKYHATPEKPTLLYYGDFNPAGKPCLIEADYEGDSLYPIRGRSCSTKAIPSLAEKFSSYSEFASALLPEIYAPRKLNESLKLQATTLESGLWINDGDGYFTFQPLPRVAQISPSFGATLLDIDGDGILDLYLVQNFFSPQLETGHMDGGVSLLLKGTGRGEPNGTTRFDPIWPCDSGLVVPTDAKSLVTCNLNDDGWPDFLVGNNDGPITSFVHRGSPPGGPNGNHVANIRLLGKSGNPTGIGARIRLITSDGRTQVAECAAGGGYLSQSTPLITFSLGKTSHVSSIEVRWPDGQIIRYSDELNRRLILLEQ